MQTVTVRADWLTYATAAATVLAAVLALASIIYSGRQARKAEAALLQERRADFELGLLADMSRQYGITGYNHLQGHLTALVRPSSSDDDLPALRAYFQARPTPAGQAKLDGLRTSEDGANALRLVVGQEIQEAIERRLRA